MLVLGCDPSLTDHGWCLVDYSDPGEPEILEMGRIRTKAKEFFAVRYKRHWDTFEELVIQFEPDYIGFEIPPPHGSWSAGLYPIWMKMAATCYEQRVPFATWMPTTIKAAARDILGDSGKMFKSDMVDAAKKVFSIDGKLNHNIADALLINYLSYRLRALMLGLIDENDLTEKERYMITRTKTSSKTGKVEKLGMLYKEGEMHYDLTDSKYDNLYPIK